LENVDYSHGAGGSIPVNRDFICAFVEKGVTILHYAGSGTRVTVPSRIGGQPVVMIGEEAFYTRSNIVSVALPFTIEVIGARAFSGCVNLKEVLSGS
jgi:hypothetical protein